LLAEWDEMKKLYRGPYIDAFCQVWFHLAQLFQRSRLKYEKVNGRTKDAKWWQYLTWPFGSGELKKENIYKNKKNLKKYIYLHDKLVKIFNFIKKKNVWLMCQTSWNFALTLHNTFTQKEYSYSTHTPLPQTQLLKVKKKIHQMLCP
jgi:hypothetical protein